MMGKRRRWDPQLVLNVSHDQSLRMGGQQELHDAQARLGPHGRKHIRVANDLFSVVTGCHSSIILEIGKSARQVLEVQKEVSG